jgi:hypothetical protein
MQPNLDNVCGGNNILNDWVYYQVKLFAFVKALSSSMAQLFVALGT